MKQLLNKEFAEASCMKLGAKKEKKMRSFNVLELADQLRVVIRQRNDNKLLTVSQLFSEVLNLEPKYIDDANLGILVEDLWLYQYDYSAASARFLMDSLEYELNWAFK